MAKLMLVCCLIVTYSYLTEIFMAFYSGDPFAIAMTQNRCTVRTRRCTGR